MTADRRRALALFVVLIAVAAGGWYSWWSHDYTVSRVSHPLPPDAWDPPEGARCWIVMFEPGEHEIDWQARVDAVWTDGSTCTDHLREILSKVAAAEQAGR